MFGRKSLFVVCLALLIAGIPSIGASEDGQETAKVVAELAPPGAEQAGGASHITLYQHQDCVDETAGVLGPAPHGSHAGAHFVPGRATLVLTLDVLNLGPATCLPTAFANLPARNAYVGHYNFKLVDVGAQHGQGPPPDGVNLRFDCDYFGTPTLIFGNYGCVGLGYFWVGRFHEIQTTINPTINILGLNVPSTGAVELVASQ